MMFEGVLSHGVRPGSSNGRGGGGESGVFLVPTETFGDGQLPPSFLQEPSIEHASTCFPRCQRQPLVLMWGGGGLDHVDGKCLSWFVGSRSCFTLFFHVSQLLLIFHLFLSHCMIFLPGVIDGVFVYTNYTISGRISMSLLFPLLLTVFFFLSVVRSFVFYTPCKTVETGSGEVGESREATNNRQPLSDQVVIA